MALERHEREGGNSTPWIVFTKEKAGPWMVAWWYTASIYARSKIGS